MNFDDDKGVGLLDLPNFVSGGDQVDFPSLANNDYMLGGGDQNFGLFPVNDDPLGIGNVNDNEEDGEEDEDEDNEDARAFR